MFAQTIIHDQAASPGAAQLDGLAALSSACISDSLDAAGARHQVMWNTLRPLDSGHGIVGRAATIEFAPTETDSDDPYADAISFIDSLPEDAVVIIATTSDARAAYWGELFSVAAAERGARGTICDGPVRDTAKIRALGFPVWSAGTRPIDFRARMAIVGQGAPVTCAGVRLDAGDLVFADDDGVVVVPQSIEEEVLGRARDRAGTEQAVVDELHSGASLREVWDQWKVL